MTSDTSQQIRKDISRFSGVCFLYNLVLYAVTILYTIVATIVISYQHMDDLEMAKTAAQAFLAADAGMYFFAVPIGLWIFWLYREKQLFGADLKHKKASMNLKTFLIFVSLLLLGQTAFNLFSNLFEMILNLFGLSLQTSVEAATAGSTSWTMLIYSGFLGPIAEEFIFRVAALRSFAKYGKIFAIIMSSILFGIFHGNLPQILFAAFIGLIFSYVTFEYSIFWAIGLHVFNNFLLGDGLMFFYGFLPNYLVPLIHSVLLYGGSAIAIFFLYHYRKEIRAYIEKNKPEKGAFSAAFKSVWFWVFTIFMIGNAIYMLFL